MKSNHGQALLICVLIGMVLLLTIPVIMFVNESSARHHVAAVRQDKAAAIAEEALAFAIRLLSITDANNPPTVWSNALTGTSASAFPVECNTTSDIVGADGGHFRLVCASKVNTAYPCPRCEPYQVYVKAIAMSPDASGQMAPLRAIEAYLSRRTIAAVLPSGLTASVALRLANVPVIDPNGALDVHWGPILVTSNNLWTVQDYPNILASTIDTNRYPRKFSRGPIDGSVTRAPDTTHPASDGKEYWAYTSVGFPSAIDFAAYQTKAAAAGTCPTPPTGCTPSTNCNGVPATSCYFPNVGTDTALFTGGYTLGSPTSVIYVAGNAKFVDVGLNAFSGAILVTGKLTLADKTIATTPDTKFYPPTYRLDYPYPWGGITAPAPGSAFLGNIASHIRGFLYTGGDLEVLPAPLSVDGVQQWMIYGVVVVDGTLRITGTNAAMKLRYNDVVNHGILVGDFQLMIDSQQQVTPNFFIPS